MRLERDENNSQQAAPGHVESPQTLQGLVLQASGARPPGSEEWESEAAGEGEYRPNRETSAHESSRRSLRGVPDDDEAWSQQRVASVRQLPERSLGEDKPPANRVMSSRTAATRPQTRRQSARLANISIRVPQNRETDDQNNERYDPNDDEETKEEEDSSPSSTSSGSKKQRKRPHYLSHEDRCQIIECIAGGEQQAALAREFGVTRAAVCHIQKHRFEILARPVDQET
ncbi:unnamed protein product [Phytophthora lilii]|uniref:Unnamed protein product n=1 Tax=Phytophthora lilii TaxID=2077276 RepID=A0A9W7D7Z7_9STRA|nr:unnamed protein product [Phytophthora lilii]